MQGTDQLTGVWLTELRDGGKPRESPCNGSSRRALIAWRESAQRRCGVKQLGVVISLAVLCCVTTWRATAQSPWQLWGGSSTKVRATCCTVKTVYFASAHPVMTKRRGGLDDASAGSAV
jgi:hypothetical protein